LPYSKSIERNYSLDTNSRGGTGVTRITPAASEGVIDTRGIVPPAIPRYFFSTHLIFTATQSPTQPVY